MAVACGGRGVTNKRVTKSVKVPPGIDSDKKIILRGEGDAGENGATPGDLHVKFHIRQHLHFVRDGNDLIMEIPISFTQAILGDEVNIDTIDGKKIKLKIPSGSENGKVFRIKSAGIPLLNSPEKKGDLYIRIHIEIPKSINRNEKSLLEEFRKVHGENSSPAPTKIGNRSKIDDFFDRFR